MLEKSDCPVVDSPEKDSCQQHCRLYVSQILSAMALNNIIEGKRLGRKCASG